MHSFNVLSYVIFLLHSFPTYSTYEETEFPGWFFDVNIQGGRMFLLKRWKEKNESAVEFLLLLTPEEISAKNILDKDKIFKQTISISMNLITDNQVDRMFLSYYVDMTNCPRIVNWKYVLWPVISWLVNWKAVLSIEGLVTEATIIVELSREVNSF